MITEGSPVLLFSPVFNMSSLAEASLSFWWSNNNPVTNGQIIPDDVASLYIDVFSAGTWHLNVLALEGIVQSKWKKEQINLTPLISDFVIIRFRVEESVVSFFFTFINLFVYFLIRLFIYSFFSFFLFN